MSRKRNPFRIFRDYSEYLNSSLQETWNDKSKRLTIFGIGSLFLVLTGILFVITPVQSLLFTTIDLRPGGAALILAGILGLMTWLILDNLLDRTSIILRANYEAAFRRAEEHPSAAKPAWDKAASMLQLYFERNLNQIKWIFWLSVFVMLIGFSFIGAGVTSAIQNPQNVTVAVVGGLAGIITEFIGATFLYIYRSTIEQAGKYTKTLEGMNSVGMAMQILDSISDEDTADSKERLIDAKIEIAKLLLIRAEENEQS